VTWEAEGYAIVPAAQARRREDLHAHVFLDRDPSPYLGTGRAIPFGDPNIVHTANRTVTFANVTPGRHRIDLVLAYADHVAVDPPVRDAVTIDVAAAEATATPTATGTPATATPSPTATASPTQAATATPTATVGPPVRVTISNFVYLPDPARVPVGGTVRWTNLDPDVHTATAEDLSWTSPVLGQGESWERTFTRPGTFPYFCEPHPQMRAEVIVE
jgi:plastocyanin